uniref:Uncharacterized protein n=1 Tax=Globodera pallida TaxID=36090 RepID=A0A183CSI3_GLOPA
MVEKNANWLKRARTVCMNFYAAGDDNDNASKAATADEQPEQITYGPLSLFSTSFVVKPCEKRLQQLRGADCSR